MAHHDQDPSLPIAPLVFVNGEYVEAPVDSDPRKVFGEESSFDEDGVHVKVTLEEAIEKRIQRLQALHKHALATAGIYPPVESEWGPAQGNKVRTRTSQTPRGLNFSA